MKHKKKMQAITICAIVSSLLIGFIKIYQFLTPWLNCCRFYPSCSEYTIQAICKHGIFWGILLGMYRILRCQPLFSGGYDPVPETIKIKLKIQKTLGLNVNE
jgi:uncharacterized protein